MAKIVFDTNTFPQSSHFLKQLEQFKLRKQNPSSLEIKEPILENKNWMSELGWEGCLYAEGPLDAKIAIIGQAPASQEVSEGRPNVGPSGQLMKNLMKKAGLNWKEC